MSAPLMRRKRTKSKTQDAPTPPNVGTEPSGPILAGSPLRPSQSLDGQAFHSLQTPSYKELPPPAGGFIDKLSKNLPIDFKLPGRTPQFPIDSNEEEMLGTRVILKGLLNRQDMGMWWLRYVILTNKEIQIFKKKDGLLGEHESQLKLEEILTVTQKSDKQDGQFIIHMKLGGVERLCARNPTERDMWVQAINAALSEDLLDESQAWKTTQGIVPAPIAFVSTGKLSNNTGKGDAVCSSFPNFGDPINLFLHANGGIRIWLSDGSVFNLDVETIMKRGGKVLDTDKGVEILVLPRSAVTPAPGSPSSKGIMTTMFNDQDNLTKRQASLQFLLKKLPLVSAMNGVTELSEAQLRSNNFILAGYTIMSALCLLLFVATISVWVESNFGIASQWLQRWAMYACCLLIFLIHPLCANVHRMLLPIRDTTGTISVWNQSELNDYTLTVSVALGDGKEVDCVSNDSTPISTTNYTQTESEPSGEEQAKVTELRDAFPTYREITLLRFLRGNKGNLEQTYTALQLNMVFKNELGPPVPSNLVTELKWGFFYFHGRAKNGSPLMVFRIANFFVKNTNPDQFIRLMFCAVEYAFDSYPEGESVTPICDFENFSIRKNVDLALYRRLITVVSDHLPELVKLLLVINTSSTVFYIWNMLKSFLEPSSIERIKFLGDYNELLDYVSPDNLPVKYGGRSTYDPNDCIHATADDMCWGSTDNKDVSSPH